MMPHLVVFVLLFSLTYTSAVIPALGTLGHQPMSPANSADKNPASSEAVNKVNPSSAAEIKQQSAAVINVKSNPFSQDSGNGNENTKNLEDDKIDTSKDGNKEQPLRPKTETLDTSKTVVPQPPKQIPNKVVTSASKNVTGPFPIPPNSKEDIIQSGALLRGFYVFLGLSALTMIYFLFRSYRLRHGSQPSTTVRKYGITARRSDMEMRPLELDDEDDDTLFEIGSPNTR